MKHEKCLPFSIRGVKQAHKTCVVKKHIPHAYRTAYVVITDVTFRLLGVAETFGEDAEGLLEVTEDVNYILETLVEKL